MNTKEKIRTSQYLFSVFSAAYTKTHTLPEQTLINPSEEKIPRNGYFFFGFSVSSLQMNNNGYMVCMNTSLNSESIFFRQAIIFYRDYQSPFLPFGSKSKGHK
ncbi:hypothetical protein Q0590_04635 [Rhodocytophaga aerolata]|uniref:Uncharacterized protein n=1 Tax=Rhodocytophaga aerolata TaxID=455078 RepID=A0ABT8R2E1_9BACT|nr:hypothetical protein [Rhodocytophaga aerolata]MDO1445524.1 hypothetical protein [Rhodocytophaga aerolata]